MADPQGFTAQLDREIARLKAKGARVRMTPTVRLNGTSDLAWENRGLMARHPEVQFYDYTKSVARMRRYLSNRMPRNYHLTFSRSETNEADTLSILRDGGTVAAVFSTKRGRPLPLQWRGFPVLDGDRSDLRFLDPRGFVVGLRAKGKARGAAHGFVVKAKEA